MKKVLSWVLALALVLSSFAISFAGDTENASKLKDANQITYTEAVDVMVATGVIAGYPDGYYYPAKAVKRAEMAKMIAVLVNGGEDVGDYYKDACKFADSKNHWAAGYIAYCANEGIIDGRDANTFDPEANVTVTEAAKMLLVALGYDSKIEGYANNANWAGNILKRAKANDFFDGIEKLDTGAVANREIAAQIIFNAMQANLVEYVFDAEIVVGDTTVSVNTKVQNVDSSAAEGIQPIALYEDAFDGDLELDENVDADDFGRPAHAWTYDKDDIGTYADTPDYTFVVTEDNKLKDAIENDFDEDFADDNVVTVAKLNGATATNVIIGDVVELYDRDAKTDGADKKNIYNAVVVRYEAFLIEDVDTDVDKDDAKDGVTAYINGIKDTDFPGFNAKTYVEDAVVAVAYEAANNSEAIIGSYVPEKVTGEVERIHGGEIVTAYTVDGTKYELAGNYDALDNKTPATESTYDFYLINGYVAGSVLVEEVSDTLYGLALDKGQEVGVYGNVDHVKIFTSEAKEADYVIDDEADPEVTLPDVDGSVAKAKVVAYELNNDDEVDAIVTATDVARGLTFDNAVEKTMTSKGVFDGYYVHDDVAIFFNDGEADDPEWAVYDYDDLADAEDVTASYIVNEAGEIVAMYVTGGFESATTDVYGFFVETTDTWKDADGDAYATVKVLVDGKEVEYTGQTTVNGDIAKNDLVKVTVKANGDMKTIIEPSTISGTALDENLTEGTVLTFAKTASKDGSGEAVTVADQGVQVVNAVYEMTTDGLEVSKVSRIKTGYNVTFYQFYDDAEVWNAVVFEKPVV